MQDPAESQTRGPLQVIDDLTMLTATLRSDHPPVFGLLEYQALMAEAMAHLLTLAAYPEHWIASTDDPTLLASVSPETGSR